MGWEWGGWSTSFYVTILQGLGLRAGPKSVVGGGNKQPYILILEEKVPSFSKCEFAIPLLAPDVAHSYFFQGSCLGGHGGDCLPQ